MPQYMIFCRVIYRILKRNISYFSKKLLRISVEKSNKTDSEMIANKSAMLFKKTGI